MRFLLCSLLFVAPCFGRASEAGTSLPDCGSFLEAYQSNQVEDYFVNKPRNDRERTLLLQQLGLIDSAEFKQAIERLLEEKFNSYGKNKTLPSFRFTLNPKVKALKLIRKLRALGYTEMVDLAEEIRVQLEHSGPEYNVPPEIRAFNERTKKVSVAINRSQWRKDFDRLLVQALSRQLSEMYAQILGESRYKIIPLWTGLVAAVSLAAESWGHHGVTFNASVPLWETLGIGLVPSTAIATAGNVLRQREAKRVDPGEVESSQDYRIHSFDSILSANPIEMNSIELAYLGSIERENVERLIALLDPQNLIVNLNRLAPRIARAAAEARETKASQATEIRFISSVNDVVEWGNHYLALKEKQNVLDLVELSGRVYDHLKMAPFSAGSLRSALSVERAAFIRQVLAGNLLMADMVRRRARNMVNFDACLRDAIAELATLRRTYVLNGGDFLAFVEQIESRFARLQNTLTEFSNEKEE